MKSTHQQAFRVFMVAAAVSIVFGCSGGFFGNQSGGNANPSIEVRDPDGNLVHYGDTYTFAATAVGSNTDAFFHVKNVGADKSQLGVTDVYVNATGFEVVGRYIGAINVGDSKSDHLRFEPAQGGNFQGTVHIKSDDPDHPDFQFTVAGTAANFTLSPPSWIQGTWLDVANGQWYFTSDNAVLTNAGSSSVDCKQYNSDNASSGTYFVDSQPTSTSYRLELWASGAVIQTQDFVAPTPQTSPATFVWNVDGIGNITFTHQ